MGNVINFPSKPSKDRTMLEREIRAGLTDEGLPQMAVDTVISNISDFIDIVSKGFSFSISIPNNADLNSIEQIMPLVESSANASASCFVNSLITERIKMEIKILVVSRAI